MRAPRTKGSLIGMAAAMMLSGCMFDVVHLRQTPTSFSVVDHNPASFRLLEDVNVTIGTGYPTRLRAGTTWKEVGRTNQGTVFSTTEQVVTVEASNMFEAWIVVQDRALTGFYLPVEKTFVSASSPVPLKISASENQK